MASVNEGNARLALLMEQHPDYPVVFDLVNDAEAGDLLVIEDADLDVALQWRGNWYLDYDEFEDAYRNSDDYYDDRPADDWYEDYFQRHAQEVIHVMLNYEEDVGWAR